MMNKQATIGIFTAVVLLLSISVIFSQSNSNTNTVSANPPTAEENKSVTQPMENPRVKTIKEGLKTIADGSKELSGWCLLIIAASIAVIVKTSNFSPTGKGIRSMYLLFMPGWLFLVFSMYQGNLVARRYMAAALTSNLETLQGIGTMVQIDFASQLSMFQIGLAFFILWLLIYLFWWIYYYESKDEK